MKFHFCGGARLAFACIAAWAFQALTVAAAFVNWETAPVHPLALSPDVNRLVVCNLPDARLEIFDVSGATPKPLGSVPVGLDPVTVRFRTSNEVWVVNRVSDSISVVDLAGQRVTATIATLDEPADLEFAGEPLRAFVSCSMPNTVQVFDPGTHEEVTRIVIAGQRPRAMAVSPDRTQVYVAIFESGNATTLLAARGSRAVVADSPLPNAGDDFVPPIGSRLARPPATGLIVRKDDAGRWRDDNNRDWTSIVSGEDSKKSGRVRGWDVADNDLAVIDANAGTVRYVRRLMNICMAVGVNPATGRITVAGTEAMNHIRFEPNLNGVFVQVKAAMIDPVTLQATTQDLNPHLDYRARSLPESQRDLSLGDPRAILWNSAGTRGYIAGMGSHNLVVLDANGDRLSPRPIETGQGPAGLALDEPRRRLYVYNRFSASLSVVDTTTELTVATVPLFDPTPPEVTRGRAHLYDTRRTSGLGQASCASCHVDGRMDRLAWDLGNPAGLARMFTNINVGSGMLTATFHPMKGPLLTTTLQDIIGHEPFHWMGDQPSIEAFNSTFTNLLGAAAVLQTNEMADFKAFLASIHFPPNPFRNLDNSLPERIDLGALAPMTGVTWSSSDIRAGLVQYRGECLVCHTLPSGLGTPRIFTGGQWNLIPRGPDGEEHLFQQFIVNGRQDFPTKVPHLRNVLERAGMSFDSTNSQAGFGFSQTGEADTLERFIDEHVATFNNSNVVPHVAGLLLCLTGGGFPEASLTRRDAGPSAVLHDVDASVGWQLTVNHAAPLARFDDLVRVALASTNRVELIARQFDGGRPRGWLLRRDTGRFQSDRGVETATAAELRAKAKPGAEVTLTMVASGMGQRLALDRDEDGALDQDELDQGYNPADARSRPPAISISAKVEGGRVTLAWNSEPGAVYRIQGVGTLDERPWNLLGEVTATGAKSSFFDQVPAGAELRFYRIELRR